jgi:deoxyribonuclease-1
MLILLFSLAFAQDLPSYEDLLGDRVSFSTAKKRMYSLHEGNLSLYCQCRWASKKPDLASCGLDGNGGTRWERTEAEHVVPASVIGATRPCWAEGGRSHCISADEVFKKAHNDLHNLYPAVGAINGYRSNKGMGLLEGEKPSYGSCDFELDEENDKVEPMPSVRGDIARKYFYMEWLYGVTLTQGQRRLFLHWHQADPVDDTERELDAAIEVKQGNSNPFVR